MGQLQITISFVCNFYTNVYKMGLENKVFHVHILHYAYYLDHVIGLHTLMLS